MSAERILFLATYFPDAKHPARGNWALEQAQAFRAKGLEVKVVVPAPWIPGVAASLSSRMRGQQVKSGTAELDGLDVTYVTWPYYPWHALHNLNRRYPQTLLRTAWPFLWRQLGPIIREFQPEFTVAHHTLVSGQVARLMKRKWKIPYIVTDHEVGDFIACRNQERIRRVFERVGTESRQMVVVSRQMQAVAKEALPGIRFLTIYNGSSFPISPVDRKGSPEGLRIFCGAKFYGRKDIPRLVRACNALIARGVDLTLRIGGDGPDKPLVEKAIAEGSEPGRIRMLGLLSPDEMRKELLNAQVFALTGWAEPFGVVFLEAMACGLPIVVCEDAGVAEVLENGRDALFTRQMDQASVENALERLAKDEALRISIARNGQERFREQFTWEKVIESYLTLLR